MESSLLNLTNGIALVFIAISPAVFVLSVTLLGNAIEQAQQEEHAARENDKENTKKEITEVEQGLEQAKKDGNFTELAYSLNMLKIKQRNTDKKIDSIKIKYNRINLTNTVLYPCIAFIACLIIGWSGTFFANINSLSYYFITTAQTILLFYGLSKIYLSLRLVQEISTNKKESEYLVKLKDSFKGALAEHEQTKKADVLLKFIDKDFPFNVGPSIELSFRFRVKLISGSVLQSAYIWFFIPDGFEFIDPPEDKSWRQEPDYELSNIRTVEIKLGQLQTLPVVLKKLKIKTPSIPGKYQIRYKIYADGYAGAPKDLTILVG